MQDAGKLTSVETIAERLKARREALGLSQVDLAAAARVAPGTIGNVEAGTRKAPRNLLAIAAALGVEPAWLESGRLPMEVRQISGPPAANDRIEQLPDGAIPVDQTKRRRIWVVGKGQGGLAERIWTDADYPVGATDEWGEISSPDPLAFLVRVNGNSMYPKFENGNFALVEPNTEPELEDVVLVRLKSGETLIKRLLSRRSGYRFGSFNEPDILEYQISEVSWVYYIAHEVPRRKIKSRH